MSHNILLTGASGYLGGSVLHRIADDDLAAYDKLYALVRTDSQADAVKEYGAEPLTLDVKDEAAVREAVVGKKITVVFYMIDATSASAQVNFIKALAEVKKSTGTDVHLLHTSGAKIFSSHAGAPTDQPLYDDATDLYDIQKAQKAQVPPIQPAVGANNTIIEESLKLGVHAYIFAPCIVYGKGIGFGNPISIQTKAIVKAAQACKRVYSVNEGRPTWPVCHISDNTDLYLTLLRAILSNKPPPSGKQGYYLASPGSVAWEDIYASMARALKQRGIVGSDTVKPASTAEQEQMAKGLGCPAALVPLQLGGL